MSVESRLSIIRLVSLVAEVFEIDCVAISIVLFIEYGRLKRLMSTNTGIATATRQIMHLAIALLILGLALTILGFATVRSVPVAEEGGRSAGDPEDHVNSTKNYSRCLS